MDDLVGEIVHSQNIAARVDSNPESCGGARVINGREHTIRAQQEPAMRTGGRQSVFAHQVAPRVDAVHQSDGSSREVDSREMAAIEKEAVRCVIGPRVESDDIAARVDAPSLRGGGPREVDSAEVVIRENVECYAQRKAESNQRKMSS